MATLAASIHYTATYLHRPPFIAECGHIGRLALYVRRRGGNDGSCCRPSGGRAGAPQVTAATRPSGGGSLEGEIMKVLFCQLDG